MELFSEKSTGTRILLRSSIAASLPEVAARYGPLPSIAAYRKKRPGPASNDQFNLRAMAQCALRLLQIDPPHIPVTQIRKKNRIESDPQGIPARAEPLLNHGIRRRINLRNRNLKHGRPNMPRAKGELAARAWNTHLN